MTTYDTSRDRDMILHPSKWPNLALPLKREGFGIAVFCPTIPLRGPDVISEDAPIEIIMDANLFMPSQWNGCERKTYKNVDALLADGWVVD